MSTTRPLIPRLFRRTKIKYVLPIVAAIIAVASLVVSNHLVRDLAESEKTYMTIWTEAMRTYNNADESTDLNLVLEIISSNTNIPIIVQDANGGIKSHRNIDIKGHTAADSLRYLRTLAASMQSSGYTMRMQLSDSTTSPHDYLIVSYDESLMLKRLSYYPYVLLGIVATFFILAIIALLNAKRAEQNKVWVGLSKETAHQLGTPISSLMAWVEILRENYPDDALIPEMNNDVKRLELVAERFSKIGSSPEMQKTDLRTLVHNVADYMAKRAPRGVSINTNLPSTPILGSVNPPLLEWVFENICKNAIDAMTGSGSITLTLGTEASKLYIEIEDTGKGISKKDFKTIFRPGYTTKKRGWGLGLSLAKRIVEEYHNGKIFVKRSDLGVGTTFRIELASEIGSK